MDVKSSLALKKKRELLGSTNKRKMSLRKNIDSLKQNECRLDITQITKCVFLGSLCLKPVPQLFDSPILLEELDMKVGNVKSSDDSLGDENFDQPIELAIDAKKAAKSDMKKRNGRKKCLQMPKMKKRSLRERNEPKNVYTNLNTIKNENTNSDTKEPLDETLPSVRKKRESKSETLPKIANSPISESVALTVDDIINRVEKQSETDNSMYKKPVESKLDSPEVMEAPFELVVIKEPTESQNTQEEPDILELELFDQNNPSANSPESDVVKTVTDYESERLKGALTPELILSDSDDDTIDQLMFNIMDIKVGPNVFDKDFFDMPASEMKEYQEFSEEFNDKADSPDSADGDKNKKFIKRTPQCKICSQVFPNYMKLKKHKATHNGDKPYLCLKCGENHTTLDQLIAHLRTHQGKHPYTCKKCNKGFKSMKALENHQPIHVLRKVVPPKKTFKCEVCNKEFRKLCDLERHTRVHTGEKPSVCNICNRRFQQAHNLNKHLLIHTQEKPFQCDICNKKFGRNDVLNRHLLTHSVKKPNHCEICMKSFIRVSQLLAHKEKYHPRENS